MHRGTGSNILKKKYLHRRRVIHRSKKLEVGRQRATAVGRQRTTEVGRQRVTEIEQQHTTEVGRERTTEIDRTKRLITQKKDSKLQEEHLNLQEASKATGIGSKKDISSRSEISLKPIDHKDTTISATQGKANRSQIDSIGTCIGIQKTNSNHQNIKHEIEW